MIRAQAEDRPPASSPPPRRMPNSDPARALAAYLAKAGIPAEGFGSDGAVFRAAVWCKANVSDLTAQAFVAAIQGEQPAFSESWITTKWRSARGAS